MPAPLPPYALALLAPLSFVPFPIARAIWWIALALAALSIGIGIRKIVGMPLATAVAASSLAVLGPAIFPGALAPIPIALTVFGALALQRGTWTCAALLLGCAMIEPHMVLPACIAAFLFVPPMRVRLIAVAAFLALLTVAAVGPPAALAYFAVMLPLHALAEVNNLAQYSLTAVLYHLGVAPAVAVRIGFVQYLCLSLIGIGVAYRLHRSTGERSWLVLVPAAFAVIGGGFIHLDQVAMVVPVACALVRERPSRIGLVVLLMLAVPGEILINYLPFALPGALISGWILAQTKADWKIVITSSFGVILVACGILALLIAGPHVAAPHVRIDDPGPLASASVAWGQFMAFAVLRPQVWWTEKLLTMIPLVALVVLTIARARTAQAPTRAI